MLTQKLEQIILIIALLINNPKFPKSNSINVAHKMWTSNEAFTPDNGNNKIFYMITILVPKSFVKQFMEQHSDLNS